MSRRTRPLLSTTRCPRAYGPNELRALVGRLKTVSIGPIPNRCVPTMLDLDGDDALVRTILNLTPSYMKPPLTMVCTRLGALCKASPARSTSRRGGAQMQLWMANATASDGQLDLLIWLVKEGFEWDPVECATTAARNGHLDVLQWIVTTPANYMAKSQTELSLTLEQFYAAVEGGHLKVVEWFLTPSPKVSYDVSTALCFAVKGGDHLVDDETQSTGLVAKIAPNYKFQEIDSSVDVKLTAAAVSSGNEHVLTLLFNKYSAEETPEHVLLTIMSGSIEMAEDAVFQAARSGHGSILQKCHVFGNAQLLRSALLGATMRGEVNFLKSTWGQEPLTTDVEAAITKDRILFGKLAIRSGKLDMVEFTFKVFNIQSLDSVTDFYREEEELLYEAAATDDICIFKLIWDKFKNILKDNADVTKNMYQIAVVHGNIEMMNLIINSDRTRSLYNDNDMTRHLAVASGDIPTVKAVLGEPVDEPRAIEWQAAEYAAFYGRLDVLKFILEAYRHESHTSLEFIAAEGGWLSVLKWLILKHPANVNGRKEHEYDLCLRAANHGAFDCFLFMFKRLTAKRASNIKNIKQRPLLKMQVYTMYDEELKSLEISIKKTCPVNSMLDSVNQTALNARDEYIESLRNRKISWKRLKIWIEQNEVDVDATSSGPHIQFKQ